VVPFPKLRIQWWSHLGFTAVIVSHVLYHCAAFSTTLPLVAGGSIRNVGTYLPDYTASHPRRLFGLRISNITHLSTLCHSYILSLEIDFFPHSLKQQRLAYCLWSEAHFSIWKTLCTVSCRCCWEKLFQTFLSYLLLGCKKWVLYAILCTSAKSWVSDIRNRPEKHFSMWRQWFVRSSFRLVRRTGSLPSFI
jgi:hypothetical protein